MAVLDEGLIAYLKAYGALSAIVSTRIYSFAIPEKATLPCVVIQRVSTPRIATMDMSGATGTLAHPRFQFDGYATSYAVVKSITDAIRAGLNGHTGTTGTGVTIRAALVDSEVPEFEPETHLYRGRSDYIIWHEE